MKFSLKSLGKFLLSSTAALLATAVLSSAAMADTFYVSAAGAQGTGDGSSAANAFGTIDQAYQAAYGTAGDQTIQLLAGTYGPSSIGSFTNNASVTATGVIDLGGLTFGQGSAHLPNATSITVQGTGNVVLNDTGATNTPVDTARNINSAMIEAYNANIPTGGLTFKNIQFNTIGVDSLIDVNSQKTPISFTNDTINLGYSTVGPTSAGYFYDEGFSIPSGEWTLTNSTIHLGAPTNVIGLAEQDYNNGAGPNALIFNGTGTSSIYDSNGNVLDATALGNLELQEGNFNPNGNYHQYPDYFNDFDVWTQMPVETSPTNLEFAQNFISAEAAPVAVPEPTSIVALCSIGASGLFFAARRRRARVTR